MYLALVALLCPNQVYTVTQVPALFPSCGALYMMFNTYNSPLWEGAGTEDGHIFYIFYIFNVTLLTVSTAVAISAGHNCNLNQHLWLARHLISNHGFHSSLLQKGNAALHHRLSHDVIALGLVWRQRLISGINSDSLKKMYWEHTHTHTCTVLPASKQTHTHSC